MSPQKYISVLTAVIDLKALRKAKGIKTQDELGTILGLNRSVISRYENGTSSEILESALKAHFPDADDYQIADPIINREDQIQFLQGQLKEANKRLQKQQELNDRLQRIVDKLTDNN